jgi:hypothetical protein
MGWRQLARGNESGLLADGDYARVIALGSSPDHDIPAVI